MNLAWDWSALVKTSENANPGSQTPTAFSPHPIRPQSAGAPQWGHAGKFHGRKKHRRKNHGRKNYRGERPGNFRAPSPCRVTNNPCFFIVVSRQQTLGAATRFLSSGCAIRTQPYQLTHQVSWRRQWYRGEAAQTRLHGVKALSRS